MYQGRFAPSPSGRLHAGSLLTGLAAVLRALSMQGHCLIRIEDLDFPRCAPSLTPWMLQELALLGLFPYSKLCGQKYIFNSCKSLAPNQAPIRSNLATPDLPKTQAEPHATFTAFTATSNLLGHPGSGQLSIKATKEALSPALDVGKANGAAAATALGCGTDLGLISVLNKGAGSGLGLGLGLSSGTGWALGPDTAAISALPDLAVQSHNMSVYYAALTRLYDSGKAFCCNCTRAELKVRPCPCAAKGLHPQNAPSAKAPSWDISAAAAAEGLVLRTELAQYLKHYPSFEDLIFGTVKQPLDLPSSLIIQRRDGIIAYNLAVVEDDHRQRINEIVRGADLLETTFLQLALYEICGYTPPHFLHVPVILDPSGRKLSKQNHAPAILGEYLPHVCVIQAAQQLNLPLSKEAAEIAHAQDRLAIQASRLISELLSASAIKDASSLESSAPSDSSVHTATTSVSPATTATSAAATATASIDAVRSNTSTHAATSAHGTVLSQVAMPMPDSASQLAAIGARSGSHADAAMQLNAHAQDQNANSQIKSQSLPPANGGCHRQTQTTTTTTITTTIKQHSSHENDCSLKTASALSKDATSITSVTLSTPKKGSITQCSQLAQGNVGGCYGTGNGNSSSNDGRSCDGSGSDGGNSSCCNTQDEKSQSKLAGSNGSDSSNSSSHSRACKSCSNGKDGEYGDSALVTVDLLHSPGLVSDHAQQLSLFSCAQLAVDNLGVSTALQALPPCCDAKRGAIELEATKLNQSAADYGINTDLSLVGEPLAKQRLDSGLTGAGAENVKGVGAEELTPQIASHPAAQSPGRHNPASQEIVSDLSPQNHKTSALTLDASHSRLAVKELKAQDEQGVPSEPYAARTLSKLPANSLRLDAATAVSPAWSELVEIGQKYHALQLDLIRSLATCFDLERIKQTLSR